MSVRRDWIISLIYSPARGKCKMECADLHFLPVIICDFLWTNVLITGLGPLHKQRDVLEEVENILQNLTWQSRGHLLFWRSISSLVHGHPLPQTLKESALSVFLNIYNWIKNPSKQPEYFIINMINHLNWKHN